MAMPFINGEFFLPNPSREGNLRFTPGGAAVAKVRGKAQNRKRLENGTYETTDEMWLSIEFWNEDAERIVTLPDNSTVRVTGSLKENKYQVNGEDRTELLIKGESFSAKTSNRQQGGQQAPAPGYAQQPPAGGGYPQAPQAPQAPGGWPAPQAPGGYPQAPGGYPQAPGGYPAAPGGYPQ